MRPTISIVNGGEQYLGVAKQKLASLEKWRRQFNQLTAKLPPIHTGDAIILIRCSEWEQHITILGMVGTGQIMLASNIDGDSVFSTYDYLKDKVSDATTISVISAQDVLCPAFNRRCQLGELAKVSFANFKWSGEAIGDSGFIYLSGVRDYEMALFADPSLTGIYARVAERSGLIATVRQGDVLLPKMCGTYLNLFGVASYPGVSDFWNLYGAASQFSITPNTGYMEETGIWLPSFFVAEPSDYYGLKPGWYYGDYPNAKYSQDDPLTSLKVSLSGVLETRLVGGLTQRGWCETVTEVNGEAKGDIYFYLRAMTVPGNDCAYRELVTGLYTKAAITIGSALAGFAADFKLETSVPGTKPDEVKMWNLDSWASQDETPECDAIGVLVIEGKKLRGYRYKNYVQQFVETDAFHSYAISDDGSLVAIFETTDSGLISRVRVFDLYGERLVAKAEDPEYLHGGFTELANSEVVAPLAALTACFIPVRAEKFTPSAVTMPFSSIGSVDTDEREYLPSLSTLRFIKDANSGLTIQKVVCKNGVDAEFGISIDECFDSTIVVDDPNREMATDRLISKWDEGGNWRGVVRGEFVGDHPDMRFNGVGKGDSGWYGVITLDPKLSIVEQEDGSYVIEGVAGELASTTCLTETMELDPNCVPNCGGEIQITAASSCGQTGSAFVKAQEADITIISASSEVGSVCVASGGTTPYSWSISCGSIDPHTGEILDISGCCGTETVTVTDQCGRVATAEITMPVGTWVLDHYEYCPGKSDSLTFYTFWTQYKGGWKIVYYGAGLRCSCYNDIYNNYCPDAVWPLEDVCLATEHPSYGDDCTGTYSAGALGTKTYSGLKALIWYKKTYYRWGCP